MKTKRIAIIQSNYIPWKGYFDIINSVDEFVLLDDVQFTRRDWRNRNVIKTPTGPQWLTVPVTTKGLYHQLICDTYVQNDQWGLNHWKSIETNYRKAPHFDAYRDFFHLLYSSPLPERLSDVNRLFLSEICGLLGIKTKLTWSSEYERVPGKNEGLISLCQQAGANSYLSGPSAKEYIIEKMYQENGISIHYMDYANYPEYSQLYPPFQHQVSILDLIFNEGPNAHRFMKSFAP